MYSCGNPRRTVLAIAWAYAVLWASSVSGAGVIRDGTVVEVRLLTAIQSETARAGQPLEFVVTRDVMDGEEILIARGSTVTGVIAEARRQHWGWTEHSARLVLQFRHTVSCSGRVIALRTTPHPARRDGVKIARGVRRHRMLWASDGDIFLAYVQGEYEALPAHSASRACASGLRAQEHSR